MPKAKFQIAVTLEDANSCKGCQCYFWQPGKSSCGEGHQIERIKILGSSARYDMRPDSCKANDLKAKEDPNAS